jgi:hypothetical protein
MGKKGIGGIIIAITLIAALGCSVQVGKTVMGVKSEGLFYTDGVLRTNYHAPFDQVWSASVKALKQFQMENIAEEKTIAKGLVTATTFGEEVEVAVEYQEKNITQVGIRVGVSGSAFAAQVIHNKIKNILLGKE